MAAPKRRDGESRDANGDVKLTFQAVFVNDAPPVDLAGARALLVRLAVASWRQRSRSGRRIEQLPDTSNSRIGDERRDAAKEGEKVA